MIISTKLTSDIRLEEALKNANIQDPLTVKKLVISGLIKQKDIRYIRENMRGTLQELDMRNASISKNRIEEGAFEGCIGLTTVIIPDSVVELEASTFLFCSHLTSVTIGRGVTSIGKYMFGYCQSFTSVYIPSSVTYIAESAFYDMCELVAIEVEAENRFYTSVDGVLYNRDKTILIRCPEGKQGNYTTPDGITTISDCAFYNCRKITSIMLSESVTTIGNNAFFYCSALGSISFGNCVHTIGVCVFSNCPKLVSINISKENKNFRFEGGVLFRKTELIKCIENKEGDYNIPDGVTVICAQAFQDCCKLTSLTVPESVTTIEPYAFAGCSNLSFVSLPDSVAEINASVFFECIRLETIKKNKTRIKFEKYYYYDCPAVEQGIKSQAKNKNIKEFISGSISLKALREEDIQLLKKLMENNRTFLIGDAYGIDTAVQQFLYKHNYQDIIVYFSGETVRNNVGNWQTNQIPNPENLSGRDRYQLKDKAMANDCDRAIMFWDGKSKGTKQNIDYMDSIGKPYIISRFNETY